MMIMSKTLFCIQSSTSAVKNLSQQLEDPLLAPRLIDLETSGLRQSPRIAAINNGANHDGTAIAAYTTSTTQLSSRRITRQKPKLSFLSVFNSVGALWTFAPLNSHSNNEENFSFAARISHDFEQINGLFDDTINDFSHHIMAITTSNESFTYSQMLCKSDHTQFFVAMETELNDHKTCKHWTLMERRNLLQGAKTIMAIWSFQRKQFPDGTLNKHKTCLCVHGGQQTWGQDYWDTCAPVVTWASVCLLLVVAKIHGLDSKSIDFMLAFPQADLDVPVYMELPAGINPVDVLDIDCRRYVLKLNKSLYGLKQAGFNWFEKLKEGLIARDFVQSQVDKCVFLWKDCIVLTYIDDCIIIGKDMVTTRSSLRSKAEMKILI
jgi:hypothetical protein